MNWYLLVLGNAQELCFAELLVWLTNSINTFRILFHNREIVLVEVPKDFKPDIFINNLGGVVKVGVFIKSVPELTSESIAEVLKNLEYSKLTFGLSIFFDTSIHLSTLLNQIKLDLKQSSKTVRFVSPQKGMNLSSVVVSSQKIQEILVVFDEKSNSWLIGKTVLTQNYKDWSNRDYGRPEADAKSGMLPLKIARMLVNLGKPANLGDSQKKMQPILLDPFCGMGTILAEALLTHWKVLGSDNSTDAIQRTSNNLNWLIREYKLKQTNIIKLITQDATHLSEVIDDQSIDAIVTEPFMGVPFDVFGEKLSWRGKVVNRRVIAKIIKGLEKLYLGSFKDWYKILKRGAKIVIVFPEITFNKQNFFVKKVIDNCERLGYTLEQGPYHYSRPQAIVKRNIYIFRKL